MRISYKKNITYLLLFLFISVKMTGLHAWVHADDDHDLPCIICDHAITHNLTPALTPDLDGFSIENTECLIQKDIVNLYCLSHPNTISSGQLFSRPPPSLL